MSFCLHALKPATVGFQFSIGTFKLRPRQLNYRSKLRSPRHLTRAYHTQRMTATSDISLDSFAYRQFDNADYHGTKIPVSKEQFMQKVHAFYNERKQILAGSSEEPLLIDGYAPFCKHIFMPNFDDRILDAEIRITEENEHLLRSAYKARKESELPVLTRFFPAGSVEAKPAAYLDLILYSREQILKEHEATGQSEEVDDAPWRLIAIKGQSVSHEVPMNPITMMRNELISQGGSGVPIERSAYIKSVEYWKDHAVLM